MKIKKFVLVLASAGIILLPSAGLASSNLTNNPFIYLGQKTSLTNYEVGTCKKHENGYWMQLADGTWAEPGSALNLCSSNGQLSSWLQATQLNPWLRSGLNTYNGTSYTSNYNNGRYGNYGNFSSYSDWYTNCVLMESLFPRPECQLGYSDYYSYPWNLTYGSNLFLRTNIGDNTTLTIAGSTSSKDLSGIISGMLLYQLAGGLFK